MVFVKLTEAGFLVASGSNKTMTTLTKSLPQPLRFHWQQAESSSRRPIARKGHEKATITLMAGDDQKYYVFHPDYEIDEDDKNYTVSVDFPDGPPHRQSQTKEGSSSYRGIWRGGQPPPGPRTSDPNLRNQICEAFQSGKGCRG
jgi:hypothetical protein